MKIIMREERLLICSSLRQLPALQWQSIQKYRYSNSTGFRFLSAARPDLWHLWEVFTDCAGYSDWIKVSLLPKSVTTPIAVSISEPAGGVVPITVAAVIGTGILGGIFAPLLIKLFKVSDPVAAGLAIGASSHAVGTSKAIEIGEVEGAMSGLAIGICGIVTVIVSIFLV